MNGFHVHAVGWVLTANAFNLKPAEARDLSELWTDLVQLHAEDLRRAHPLLRLLAPRSLPLSQATRNALATLMARMAALHPERFGGEALRQRRDHWARQAAMGFMLSVLTAILVPKSWPVAVTVAPTFFLMGFACLLPTLMLWRAAAAAREYNSQNHMVRHLPRSLSNLFGHRS